MATDIYLIRHGVTDWNEQRKIQGQTDIPLNERGIYQSERLAEHLLKKSISSIYSSDMLRASKTAQIIADKIDVPLYLTAKLRERNVGEWEGLTIKEVRKNFESFDEVKIRGGMFGVEKTRDVQQKIIFILNRCLKENRGKLSVMVSHGMVINILLKMISRLRPEKKIRLANTSISHIKHTKKGWSICTINKTPHLDI